MERLGSCGHLADAASHQGYAEKEEGAEWYSVCDQTLRRSICVGRTLCLYAVSVLTLRCPRGRAAVIF